MRWTAILAQRDKAQDVREVLVEAPDKAAAWKDAEAGATAEEFVSAVVPDASSESPLVKHLLAEGPR